MAVRENQNITLTCKADGYPTPKLMWKREDGQNININRHNKGERSTRLSTVLDFSKHSCNVEKAGATLVRDSLESPNFEKEMLCTIDKSDSQVSTISSIPVERSFNFTN